MQKEKKFWYNSFLRGSVVFIGVWIVVFLIIVLLIELGMYAITGVVPSVGGQMIVGIGLATFFFSLCATLSTATEAYNSTLLPSHGLSKCPLCEKEVKGGKQSRFCVGCGVDLDPQCNQCNLHLRAVGSTFCYQCGGSIVRPTPTIALQEAQGNTSASAKPIKVDALCTGCSACNDNRNPQDAFCGMCGKSLISASTDQTM